MDWYYIAAIGAFILSMIIQASLKSTFKKYSSVLSEGRYTANEAAELILRSGDVPGIVIKRISGSLTDNYNPKEGTINLSQTVYGSRSIAAIAVAAHECGHAIQDSRNYIPYRLRQFLAPVAGFSSRAGVYLAIAGLLIGGAGYRYGESLFTVSYYVITAGIIVYLAAFLFYLIMVPVEYNASNRALKIIKEMGLVGEDQVRACKKVLRAAGRTYVIALASSAVTLLRLLAMRGRRERR